MMKTLLALAPALAPGLAAAAEGGLPARYRTLAPAELRAAPDAGAEETAALEEGRILEILAFSDDGAWALTGRGEGAAWLPLAGLERLGGAAAEGLPMRCYGTEPFWGLNLPSAFFGEFERPEHPETPLQLTGSDETLAASGRARLWTFVGDELRGHLVVRNEVCSDGMSDRPFGLSATLSLAETAGAVHLLLGCCSLTGN
ncbi:hypothetical protein [Poseidonocella sp. HB161398]|uniref:hypothetical protein n=1 Tax=Poseidonocella sp. HB161398 TaxID=2320855 RepID=UPI0011089F2A|nr:hypothetical protein [Poseidonocella sp. HB161398]